MRRKEREITDFSMIQNLVENCHVLRLAMFDEEFPYIVPTNFGYEFIQTNLICYIHGAKQGKKIQCIEKNPKIALEMDDKHRLIEYDRNAAKYSFAYQSLIGLGQAEIITDYTEKVHAFELLMQHETGKSLDQYNPLPEHTVNGTSIIKITLESYTCKQNVHPDLGSDTVYRIKNKKYRRCISSNILLENNACVFLLQAQTT